jgi:hypothetical protein
MEVYLPYVGVISFTFRSHYLGWVPEMVDGVDMDRAKLILSLSGVEPL